MKIRERNKSGHTWEVLEESAGYYIVPSKLSQELPDAFPKSLYEPVPTGPRWVDVTAECVAVNSSITHDGVDVHTAKWHGIGDYRINKVFPCEMDMRPKAYFTVEKKEST